MRRRDSRERSFRSLSYLSTPDRLQDQMNNYCGREKRRVAPWRISRVAREVPKRKNSANKNYGDLKKKLSRIAFNESYRRRSSRERTWSSAWKTNRPKAEYSDPRCTPRQLSAPAQQRRGSRHVGLSCAQLCSQRGRARLDMPTRRSND